MVLPDEVTPPSPAPGIVHSPARTQAILCAPCLSHTKLHRGRVAEWLMAPVLKTGVPERVSGVRIPPLPPFCLLGLGVAIGCDGDSRKSA
jgi:hypothetical protein